jgi:hypothetical protein
MKKILDSTVFAEEWQRPPQWRWKEAMEHFANPYLVSEIKKDEYLYRVCQFYKYRKRWDNSAERLMSRYPDIKRAFDCYVDVGPSGWKWYIEALLLTDADSEEISKMLHSGMSADVVEAYKKLFFDVDIYGESERAVDVNIFGATRDAVASFNNYDFTWKLIAYTWGADKFLAYSSPRKKRVDKKLKKWFEDVIQDRVIEHTFHISSNMKLMYNEAAIDILKTAQSFWTVADEDLDQLKSRKKDEYLESLLESVDTALQNAELKLGKEEKRQYYAQINN